MEKGISYDQVALVLEQGQIYGPLKALSISFSAPTNVHTCCLAPGGP